MIDKIPLITYSTSRVELPLSAPSTASSRPSRYRRLRHLVPGILIVFTLYHLLPSATHHLKRVYDHPQTAKWWQTGSSANAGTPVATSLDELERQYQTLLDQHNRSMNLVDSILPWSIELYADQVKVVLDLDRFTRTPISPNLPSTKVDVIIKSASDLRDSLFAKLFPYIASAREGSRSFDQLIDSFTRPKGILLPCSNKYLRYALHLITTLKKVHLTTLPILIVHAGPDDLSPANQRKLKSLSPDVEVFDLLHVFSEDHVGILDGGYAIKPFALLASPFKETILVDADVVFMQDPNELLQDLGYRETGTLFFRDRELLPEDDAVHTWFEGVMENRVPSAMLNKSRWWKDRASREEMESGVVVVDKGRRDVVLGLAFVTWLNTKQVRSSVMYRMTLGDKETYWIGFELAGVPYYFDPPFASTIGHITYFNGSDGVSTPEMCSEHHLHLDRKGRPFWWNCSLLENKHNATSNYFLPTVYSSGTVDWATEMIPYCMRSLKEDDIVKLEEVKTDSGLGFDELYTRVLGAAVLSDLKEPVT